ncbi:hypothetical protein LINPERPRIM_LOCUS26838 [Linum perenne]
MFTPITVCFSFFFPIT